jgi:acyl-CoA reductase-like NAD-dependent aldehyde dehydrogenase
MSIFKQYIGGEGRDAAGGGTWDLVNPATELVVQPIPFGGAEDVKLAVDAAADAFPSWSKATPYERSDVLMAAADVIAERADDYAKVTTEESGKPLTEALAEWRGAPNYIRWAAEESKRVYGRTIPPRAANRRIEVSYSPLGVVGSITAWNFPVYNVNRVWSSALAAGCTVVSRPSEFTPRSAMLLAEAMHEAGLPPGVANVVNGDPETMGQTMLDDSRVRKIQFTGSTRVGKLLLEGSGRTVTKLSLELGGNAPVIIFADAGDIAGLAKHAVNAKYRNSGQVCVSPQRFYVQRSVVEEFTAAAVDAAKAHRLGNGLEEGTTLGPLINARQLERVERIVAETVEDGATLLCGGKRAATDRGFFFEATVIADVKPGSPLHEEEVFGPVLPIIPFDDGADAVAMANATEYGLAAYVHTNDLVTALRVSEDLEYGLVAINDWVVAAPEAPFGGVKQSGVGRESGPEGLHEYLEAKTRYFGGIG